MYNQVFNLHTDLLKAMSHAKRLEIIHLLRKQELSVGEIQNMLGLEQANLSQHLMVLRDAGVVSMRKKGKNRLYKLAHKNFLKANDLLREVLIQKHKKDPLADELTKKMADLVPLVHDPVCNMRLSPKTSSYAIRKNGETYYFCAKGCLNKFRESTNKYIKKC